MTTLSIEGRKVKVSDDFLSMTPEQQNDTVEEIAAALSIESRPKYPNMSQVNRGIADSIGGVVDLLNPFDGDEFGFSTGSAKDGLASLMDRAGIEVAEGDPETIKDAALRGVGNASGAILPVSATAQALKAAPGIIGSTANIAQTALATRAGVAGEAVAGGLSAGAEQAAEDAGLPEWAQNTAAVAAPVVAAGGVLAVVKGAQAVGKVSPAGAAVRGVKAAVAPYTKSGATEVARRRLQTLAGGRERAEGLANQVGGENPLGLTPAQQTQDPNMIGLEQLASEQDPLLREALKSRGAASRHSAQSALLAGDPELFQALLTGANSARLEQQVMPWLLPYLVGGVSGVAGE